MNEDSWLEMEYESRTELPDFDEREWTQPQELVNYEFEIKWHTLPSFSPFYEGVKRITVNALDGEDIGDVKDRAEERVLRELQRTYQRRGIKIDSVTEL